MQTRLLGRIGRYGGLLAVCVGVALTSGASAASAAESVPCANITGSGSSLQNVAQKEVWDTNWSTTSNLLEWLNLICNTMSTVTYEPTSSGKGLAEWGSETGTLTPAKAFNKEKLDEFVGTDVGPEGGPAGLAEGMVEAGTQIAKMDEAGKNPAKPTEENKVITIPVAQSAIAIIVSLPVGCTPTLGTKPEAATKNMPLWEVWDTDVLKWNEGLVEGHNVTIPSVAACEKAPTLEAREVGSGTTAGFKRYLNDLEKTTYGTFVSTAAKAESASEWPNLANKKETGNETGGELAKNVYETPGTMGYADLADAIKAGFGKAGSITKPEEHENAAKEKYYSFIVKVPNGGASLPEGGEAVSPGATTAGGGANCSSAGYSEPTKVGVDIDWSRAGQSNATSGTAGVYPICTLTFDVAWEHYSWPEWENPVTKGKETFTLEDAHTVIKFLHLIELWWKTPSQVESLEAVHFAAVPKKVGEESEAANMSIMYFSEPNK